MKNRTKKSISVLLAGMLVLGLCACGGGGSGTGGKTEGYLGDTKLCR